MAVAVDHSRHFGRSNHHRREIVADTGERATVRPLGASMVGTLAVVAGAWAGVAGLVGPYFDYRPTARHTWAWTDQNWLLHVAPGAVAVLGGLMILGMTPIRRAGGRGVLELPALLVLAAGAWLVIGAAVWPTFESGAPFLAGVSASRNLINQVGSALGPGFLLAVFGGMALKAAVARPGISLVGEEPPADTDPGGYETVEPGAPVGSGRVGATEQAPVVE